MNPVLILKIVGELYRVALRDLLIKAVEDPNEQWDDFLLGVFDVIFGYGNEEGK